MATQTKTITLYKQDIDNLKQNLTEKHIEVQEMRAENMAVKEISDRRQGDINRLKNELGHLSDQIAAATSERNLAESDVAYLKDEKRKLLSEIS